MSNFIDDYEHLDLLVQYVPESVLSQSDGSSAHKKLKHYYFLELLNSCNCRNDCKEKCSHNGNYRIHENGEMVLADSVKDLIYECSPWCSCSADCLNRCTQFGPRNNLKIIDSPTFKSKGLITLKDIPAGGFICEYSGELLTRKQALQRTKRNDEKGWPNYILCLRERSEVADADTKWEDIEEDIMTTTYVDPSCFGNIGRYLNHSCDPNCEIYSVRVDNVIPKIAIFAKRFINANEELCFHYGGGVQRENSDNELNNYNQQRISCLCGKENCEKYLPNLSM